MATTKRSSRLTGHDLLEVIWLRASFQKRSRSRLFLTRKLDKIEDRIREVPTDDKGPRYHEWRCYERAVIDRGKVMEINILHDERDRFKRRLQQLEESYLERSLLSRDAPLEDLVVLGQEILRRKYFALLRNPGKRVLLSPWARMIIETGAEAIQVLGRAPASPKYRYRKYLTSGVPDVASLGIEILSSGAFPDWTDASLAALRDDGTIERMGFETVLLAEQDTPRARVLTRLLKEGNELGPLVFPKYQRLMLDLELMRLGQATTPGTYKMLLNSFYQGALFVDHSTNVSEQVQIIYEEENWKPACVITPDTPPEPQGEVAAKKLLKDFFRDKAHSPINRDHPRTARIEFGHKAGTRPVADFFRGLLHTLDTGVKIDRQRYRRAPVHSILPVLRLEEGDDRVTVVRWAVDTIKGVGLTELAITATTIRHVPGLLQYFDSAKTTNHIMAFAKGRGIRLRDGRTVDMVATANKAIEAAAGAIESGQGCIKIGLLGLTREQMVEFIRRVKNGLDATLKRQQNQLLVFIAIVDEPLVSEEEVLDQDGHAVSNAFIELMAAVRHDIILLDTMHKGADDARLVNGQSSDRKDEKGGHLTIEQLRDLVRKAHRAKLDLWVAGSYTEAQVYEASKEPPETRPSLICLGGAERNAGALRLDPSAAYVPGAKDKKEKKLAALVEYDAEIKFLLSRDNKLARDAGHVVGELQRKKDQAWVKIESLRKEYQDQRQEYFKLLDHCARMVGTRTRNVDTLYFEEDRIFTKLPAKERNKLKKKRSAFEMRREVYVEIVAKHLYNLCKDSWTPKGDANG